MATGFAPVSSMYTTTAYCPSSGFVSAVSPMPARSKRTRKWTFDNASESERTEIAETARKLLKEYEFKRRLKEMTNGIKWFLFFLGLALLLNFGALLNVVRTIFAK